MPAGTPGGVYQITAVFSGGANFDPSINTGLLTIRQVETVTVAENAAATASASSTQTVTLTANVRPATVVLPDGINEGTITFTVRDRTGRTIGSPVTSPTVVGGRSSADFTLPAVIKGNFSITAVYNGGPSFQASRASTTLPGTLSVTVPTTTAVTADVAAPFLAGARPKQQSLTVSATVTNPLFTVNQGIVTFAVQDNDQVISRMSVAVASNSQAKGSLFIPAGTSLGTYTITASYGGSILEGFLPSSDASRTLSINQVDTIVSTGKATFAGVAKTAYTQTYAPLTLIATVKRQPLDLSTTGAINEGTVTFRVHGADSSDNLMGDPVTTPVVNGQAQTQFAVPDGLPAGTYLVDMIYGGTANYAESSFPNGAQFVITRLPSFTTARNVVATFSRSSQTLRLQAVVTGGIGLVNEGLVTFTVATAKGQIIGTRTSADVINGNANADFSLPADTAAGT